MSLRGGIAKRSGAILTKQSPRMEIASSYLAPFSRQILLAMTILISASTALAQTVAFTGIVHEKGTNEGIPGASLHILGTSNGARSNADGKFRLLLTRGKPYVIQVAAIGYQPDTLRLSLFADSIMDVALKVAPLVGKPITVSAISTREEARRIMRKVIAMKDAWQSQINDYQFQVYSRGDISIGNDTTKKIVGILESVANGYWKRGKGYAERITARHQTADLPSGINRIALFDVENFYNDRIQVEDYDVVSPIAHDAFSRYDYDLLGEGSLNGVDVWKIAVLPLNTLFPAFSGTLWIDKTDFTIVYLDLSPNDAIHLAPLQGIKFQQTFSFIDNKFWMPSDINFDLAVKLQVPIIPAIHFSQSATLQHYSINTGLPDSLFVHGTHTVAPRADSVDSIQWVAMRTIPLSHEEDTTYRKIDSVIRVDDSINKHAPPASFDPVSLFFDVLSPNLYQYNRVEGSHFEIEQDWELTKSRPLTVDAMVGYGVGDGRWKYSAGFSQALTMRPADKVTVQIPLGGDIQFSSVELPEEVSTSIGGRVYDEYVPRSTGYSPIENTLTALLLHSDYPDYYRARGFDVEFNYMPSRAITASIQFTNEDETSLPNVTNFSLLARNDTFRVNPSIDEGRLHEVSLALSVTAGNPQASIGLDFSNPGIGSEFTFLIVTESASFEQLLGGWGKLNVSFDASLSKGDLPCQKLFFFDTRNSVLAHSDVFRTMSPFEFQGTSAFSFMVDQNFYDLPTRALGITLPLALEWHGFVNIAGASFENVQPLSRKVQTLNSPFVEAGFGIGNILNALRFDATWRLTHMLAQNFFVTGTVALSF